jgi:hypothetical protein
MESDPSEGGWNRRLVVRWVLYATTTSDVTLELCCNKDITQTWNYIRQKQKEQLTVWLKDYCRRVNEVYGSEVQLNCVVTGGGTIDILVHEIVQSTVRAHFLNMEFMDHTATNHQYVHLAKLPLH